MTGLTMAAKPVEVGGRVWLEKHLQISSRRVPVEGLVMRDQFVWQLVNALEKERNAGSEMRSRVAMAIRVLRQQCVAEELSDPAAVLDQLADTLGVHRAEGGE